MTMQSYGYDYFCGANVLLQVNDFPVLEAAGISYNLMDSSAPVYGYSSRLFDAVAPGQIIVQGSIVINFVHHNYLFECIRWGLAGFQNVGNAQTLEQQGFTLESDVDRRLIEEAMKAGATELPNQQVMRSYEEAQWTTEPTLKVDTGYEQLRKVSPLGFSPLNISISMGKRYTIDILSAYFIGRGSTIQIDESVIVEEYPFFARDLRTRYHVESR